MVEACNPHLAIRDVTFPEASDRPEGAAGLIIKL